MLLYSAVGEEKPQTDFLMKTRFDAYFIGMLMKG